MTAQTNANRSEIQIVKKPKYIVPERCQSSSVEGIKSCEEKAAAPAFGANPFAPIGMNWNENAD